MAEPVASLDEIEPIHLRLKKYQALGNDFLISLMSEGQKEYLDSREIIWADVAIAVCDRKKGIGADGLILAVGTEIDDYEWSSTLEDGSPKPHATLSGSGTIGMVLYNSDGSAAHVSGNGMGCVAHAVARSQEPWKSSRLHSEALAQVPFEALPSGTKRGVLLRQMRNARLDLTIVTGAGNRHVSWNNELCDQAYGQNWLTKSILESVVEGPGRLADFLLSSNTEELAGDPDPTSWNAAVTMPFVVPGPDVPAALQEKIHNDFGDTNFGTGDVGNPHLVIDVGRDLDSSEVSRYGPEYASHFLDGINVEFIYVPRPGEPEMRMQIWERGAGITEACGTGAVVATWLAMSWGILADVDWEQLQEEWQKERSHKSGGNIVPLRFPLQAPYSLVHMPGGAARVLFGDASNLATGVPHRLRFEPLLYLIAHYVGSVDYPILRFLSA